MSIPADQMANIVSQAKAASGNEGSGATDVSKAPSLKAAESAPSSEESQSQAAPPARDPRAEMPGDAPEVVVPPRGPDGRFMKVNGQDIPIPESEQERIELMQMGHDYRQKTQSLADERRQIQLAIQQQNQFQQNIMPILQQLRQQTAPPEPKDEYVPLDESDGLYDPAVKQMHRENYELRQSIKNFEQKFGAIERYVTERDYEQAANQAADRMAAVHKARFGRDLTEADAQRLGQAAQYFTAEAYNNPQVFEQIHNLAFHNELATAAQHKVAAQLKKDSLNGVVHRSTSPGAHFPNNFEAENRAIIGDETDGSTAMQKVATWLKQKYGGG